MKMNRFEKIVMNNLVRRLILRHIEAPILYELGGSLEGMNVLEIGCGEGHSTRIILDIFKPKKIVTIDLDSQSIKRAYKNLSDISSDRLQIIEGDVLALEFNDHSFDAVVNFAALHHVVEWQKALSEIHRVLKKDGKFFFEEVTQQWLQRWYPKLFFAHPTQNRFTTKSFQEELISQKFIMHRPLVTRKKGDFIFGVCIAT
nr:class I SAM-dependent methyltransferase [Bdellovibrio sp. HAGR004]